MAFVGTEGDRLFLRLTVVEIEAGRPKFGKDVWVYHFEDDDGNRLVWFSHVPRGKGPIYTEGNRYSLDGTVVKHYSHKGTHETHIARVEPHIGIGPRQMRQQKLL